MPNDPVDIYIGTRLRTRRIEMNIPQNALGNIVGITFQQLQKYEKGVNRIASSRLYQFSIILKVPITYFFEGYGVCSKSETPMDSINNAQYREIVSLATSLSMIKDRNLKKYIKTVIEGALKIDGSEDEVQ